VQRVVGKGGLATMLHGQSLNKLCWLKCKVVQNIDQIGLQPLWNMREQLLKP
jgi:hypothetical protein